jgi:hypothetical protein
MLLLRANQTVPVPELGAKLWERQVPVDPRGAVQKYMMRLRRALAPTGCMIHTDAGGYRLELAPGLLDVDTFTGAVEQGVHAAEAGEWGTASDRLTAALDLWRAVPPLSNVGSEVLQRAVPLHDGRPSPARRRRRSDECGVRPEPAARFAHLRGPGHLAS